MKRDGSLSRRSLLAVVAALSMAVAPIDLEAEAKAGRLTSLGYEWVLICASAGNFYLNLMTGERRSAPDDQHAPCDSSACHSGCRRRLLVSNEA
jgi:hypothetical protein